MSREEKISFNEKQIKILKAAERLFAESGYANIGIRVLTEAACFNSAMVSYYFGSKENLIRSLVTFRSQDLESVLETLDPAKDGTLAQLEYLLRLLVNKVFSHRDFHKVVLQLRATGGGTELLSAYYSVRKRCTFRIGEMIKIGQLNGTFRKEVDVQELLSVMVGTLTDAILQDIKQEDTNFESDLEVKNQGLNAFNTFLTLKRIAVAFLIP